MAGRIAGMIESVSAIAAAADQLEQAVRDVCPRCYLPDAAEDVRQGDTVGLAWREALMMTARAVVSLEKLEGRLASKQVEQERRHRTRIGFSLRPATSAAGGEVPSTGPLGDSGEDGEDTPGDSLPDDDLPHG